MIRDKRIPDNWKIETDEIMPYVFRVLAVAEDGRRINLTGSDEERMRAEVVASIAESDRQITEKRSRRND